MKDIHIIHYEPQHAVYFAQFNKAWIEAYYTLEPQDIFVLENPEEAILNKGGSILFAVYNNIIIGTVALKWIEAGIVELTKMAVDERFRGLGAGKLLCKSAIAEARKLQAEKVILYANTRQSAAIRLYRQLGFTELPIEKGAYQRANIKMELPLMRTAITTPWFDRKFDFPLSMDQYDSLYERLQKAPAIYKETVASLSEDILQKKPDNKWSIKEHIGHVTLLEPLWLKRFQDIQAAVPGRENHPMSPADLNNTATDKACFNHWTWQELTCKFQTERNKTLHFLSSLEPQVFTYNCIHPRLQKPMRIIDLMYFVAEHDDHHINIMQTIIQRHHL